MSATSSASGIGKPTDVPRDSNVSGLGLDRAYQASLMKHYSFYNIAVVAHSFRFVCKEMFRCAICIKAFYSDDWDNVSNVIRFGDTVFSRASFFSGLSFGLF